MGTHHRFLVVAMPAKGHVAPIAPVVRDLIDRGHEVVWYGSIHFKDAIEATGAEFAPIKRAVDFGDGDVERHFPERKNYDGLAQMKFDFKRVFIDVIPGMVADLEEILDRFPADVILTDPTVIAGRVLSHRRNLPWAIFNISVLGFAGRDIAPFGLGMPPATNALGRLRVSAVRFLANKVIFRDVQQHLDLRAAENGWPTFSWEFGASPYLMIQPCVPEFEYPRTDMPPQVHFVGSIIPESSKPFDAPDWWHEIVESTRPIVLVTQGTVANMTPHLIQPTLDGLANEDVTVIATTGGKTAEEMGIRVPKNAHVVPFLPYNRLMPHVDLMVTNGGYGSVMIALSHGVPLVVGGTTEDKTEVSARIAYSGVGINLKTATPSPDKVRDAVRQVLDDPRYRSKARAIEARLARLDARQNSIALLEELAATQRPVTKMPAVRPAADAEELIPA